MILHSKRASPSSNLELLGPVVGAGRWLRHRQFVPKIEPTLASYEMVRILRAT